jgi:hypothetical protein
VTCRLRSAGHATYLNGTISVFWFKTLVISERRKFDMMRKVIQLALILLVSGGCAVALGQMIKRSDAVWARTVPPGTITVDGLLKEPAWALADSIIIRFDSSNSNVIPGSGWKPERSGGSWNGVVTDPTYATFKFLVQGNEMIVGVFARDSSVGGGLFNECDALLMNIRDHSGGTSPAPPFECGYGWVTESWGDPNSGNPGADPIYFGPAAGDRTVWSGATFVFGKSNDDKNGGATLMPDAGYSMEIRFDLVVRGYNVTRPEGDIIEFSCSVYDADWQWPYNDARYYGNRAWWQGQWGNSDGWSVGRIYVRPNVTLSTSPLPAIEPDLVIPNGSNYGAPTIDGNLSEPVWKSTGGFTVAFGDSVLRRSYPGVGRWRSGEYQPKLSGATGTPPVIDPGIAQIKYFFVGDTLCVGADVSDWFVTSVDDYDRWDGIRLTINSRDSLEKIDHALLVRLLDVRIGPTGQAVLGGYLKFLDSVGLARVGLKMKTGTTINNPNDVDAGYTIEMKLSLSAFGYPPGRGDGVLFLGATLFDHDAFLNPADDYGTRVWFMREHDRASAPAWCYMDPNKLVAAVENVLYQLPSGFSVSANYPNPFNPSTTIHFVVPAAGSVTLNVFDLLGRCVRSLDLGIRDAGENRVRFDAGELSSGVYFYRLQLTKHTTGAILNSEPKRMLLIR